jgi:hypothetical protein
MQCHSLVFSGLNVTKTFSQRPDVFSDEVIGLWHDDSIAWKNLFDNGKLSVDSDYSLNKCMPAIEGEGGELPMEWRVWRAELELRRTNWQAAHNAAKYVS